MSAPQHTASDDVKNSFARFLKAIDARDWAGVRAEMAPEVYTDYQNLFGAAPGVAPADGIVQQWKTLLGPLDATQHLLGTPAVHVDGDRATLDVSVRGYHYAHGIEGGDEWMVAGQYNTVFERTKAGWKLTSLRLDTHAQTGNRALLGKAAARVHPLPAVDGVKTELVRFSSHGERLAGHLYLPADAKGPVPGVVVLGSWTTVKEQMAGLYAQRLAQQGYAALAFDPTGHGESAGALRNTESPTTKIEDVQAAAAYLAHHPAVAGENGVNALGICAGAGYVAGAAAQASKAPHSNIKSVALVAPWLHDSELVEAIYGGKAGVDERLAAGRAARTAFEQTGVVKYVPAVSTEDKSAAMFGPFAYYLSKDRGAIDAWPNQFAVMAWTDWLTFNPHPFAADLKQPVLIVHSEQAAIPDGARRFYSALSGEKRAHWMSGDQFDFYDTPATVDEAVGEVVKHFEN